MSSCPHKIVDNVTVDLSKPVALGGLELPEVKAHISRFCVDCGAIEPLTSISVYTGTAKFSAVSETDDWKRVLAWIEARRCNW